MKFTEAQLDNAIIQLLGQQGYPHVLGEALSNNTSGPGAVPRLLSQMICAFAYLPNCIGRKTS